MSGAGLPQLVQEIKLASENIRKADEANRQELEGIKASVNELYKRTGRPGAEWSSDLTDERKDAAAMVIAKHSLDVPKYETTEYQPGRAQVDEAVMAMHGLRQLIRHGDPNKLSAEVRKSLSSFSFGANSFALSPVMANRTLSCLVDPTDLSGLVDNVSISGPSLQFLIDNARMALAAWQCESNCFSNNPSPDLNEGLGTLNIKPETIRMVVCATSDLLEDASFDVEGWLFRKISEGMRATVNAAILLGDGVGKPLGLMSPGGGIPVCQVSPATAPGQFSFQDLLMLKYEIPIQWLDGASYLMNQRTFALLQTMSSADGRPLFGQFGTNAPGTGFSFAGSPINIVTQMPDVAAGATPVAFGNWKRAYTIVTRKLPTMQIDPYSAGFCRLFKFEARIGGAPLCPNAARLLRIN